MVTIRLSRGGAKNAHSIKLSLQTAVTLVMAVSSNVSASLIQSLLVMQNVYALI